VFGKLLWTFCVMVTLAGPCCALDVFDQLWPEVDMFVKTSENSRLFFMGAGTRVRQGGYTDGQLGAHFDMYFGAIFRHRAESRPDATRSRLLSVRLGYLFGKTPKDSSDPFVEHTPIIEVTPRYYLPKSVLLTNRNRYDFRFVDGVYTPRYRNRLKIERTIQRGSKRAITPYAHVEGFYDRRFNGFHRFRYSVGGEFEINKRFVLEAYYLRQQDSQAEPRGLNVAGIGLQIYFH
jgi:hypothetical protein